LPLTIAATQYLGQVYRTLGDYPRAITLFRGNVAATTGERTAERLGMHALPSVLSRGFLSDCLSLIGEFAEGTVHGRDAQQIAEAVGHPFSIVSAYGASATLYVRKGALDIAIPLLARGLDLCRVWNVSIWLPTISASLGLAYALSGRLDDARDILDESLRSTATRVLTGPTVAEVCQGYLLVGNIEVARQLAENALKERWIQKQRGSLAYLLHVLGELASSQDRPDAATADGNYRHALAQATELGMRPLVAHCHLGLGNLARHRDQREQAQKHLRTAATMYREMDMRFWVEQAEAAMIEIA
jgi:tetratricopeptide (TPR) repeat protein